MVESDYPHADSTWPDTQAVCRHQLGRPARGRAARPSPGGNAARLFRHPLPDRDDWRTAAP